jgi:hypothetical protein
MISSQLAAYNQGSEFRTEKQTNPWHGKPEHKYPAFAELKDDLSAHLVMFQSEP